MKKAVLIALGAPLVIITGGLVAATYLYYKIVSEEIQALDFSEHF